MGRPMGIGEIGKADKIFKRNFRWTMQFTIPCEDGVIPEYYVKTAGRPQIEIDEHELHFLNGVTWIPGKGKFQSLSVTYYDVAHRDMVGLYNWVLSVYDFNNPTDLHQSEKRGWSGFGVLNMYEGCGNLIESWGFDSCWPQSINFGNTLAYDDGEISTIELTIRYSQLYYKSHCGMPQPKGCCIGCE